MPALELARKEWIQACHFHDLSGQEVLREVTRRVKTTQTNSPVILLDLDSTLYEVGPRTLQILNEWIASQEFKLFSPEIQKAFQKLELSHIGYSLKDTFLNLGLTQEVPDVRSAWESARKFWRARFFTHEYLEYDRVYPGAVEFVQGLYRQGAILVYLTGRDEPGMGDGTRLYLESHGFPWGGEKTHLLTKTSSEISDIEHKQGAAGFVKSIGQLIASFENEPPNLVALYECFPQAMHVFVDTFCSDRPAKPCQGLYRIRRFD